jgi:putative flippase GtrA
MTRARLRRLLTDRQFLRFVVAGVANTVFGFGTNIAAIMAGLPVWLAMLIGTVAGIAFNFLTYGGYAFRDMSAKRLPRYLLGYAAVYAVGLAAFHILQLVVPGAIACQVLLVVPLALLSYLIMSRFVFRRNGVR